MSKLSFHPHTPKIEPHVISPYHSRTFAENRVVRIKKNIYKGMIYWSNMEGELILGSEAEEGGGEPSLEGGKVVSLTRGCGRECL